MQYSAKVLDAWDEAEGIRTVKFSRGFDFLPGQFAVVRLPCDDTRAGIRTLSIASSPTEDFLLFTTKLSDSGFKHAFAALKKGDLMTVKGPSGNFVLDEKREAIMISGGVGITPLRSMIKYATDKSLSTKITLLYSNRTPGGIAYRKDLEDMSKENNNFRLVNTITGDTADWKGERGRIDENMISKYASSGARYYICGPPAMVEAVRNAVVNAKIDQGSVMVEDFEGY
ncbi:MAG: FAD-dependent oxidoreductase [Candidatus Aenigmarchaeota archaeon]|nr:FAD-dependent oxidoreductase [Candidatus Aenigmarchaeota archaeon]